MTKAERLAKAEKRANLYAEIAAYHASPMIQFTVRDGAILEQVYEIGGAARRNRGHVTGEKTHRLSSQYVRRATPASRMRVGLWSCVPCCGCTQGQIAGQPYANTMTVTCTRC